MNGEDDFDSSVNRGGGGHFDSFDDDPMFGSHIPSHSNHSQQSTNTLSDDLFSDASKDLFAPENTLNASMSTVGPGGVVKTLNAIQYHCDYCHKDISNVVRIKCSICHDFDLCVECFSVGAQITPHQSSHDYQIMDNMHFPLFTEDWGADEELLLLEAIDMYGLGNWSDISEHVGSKSSADCRDHYFGIYINVPTYPLPDTSQALTTHEMILNPKKRKAVLVNPLDVNKPPGKAGAPAPPPPPTTTPAPSVDMKSHPLVDAVGYMKNRGEFETEWENEAERFIANMVFDEDELPEDRELKLKVCEVYHQKLVERLRRQNFILEHGLLDFRKLQQSERRKSKDERAVLNAMKPFLQLMDKRDHDDACRGALVERQIRRRIEKLQYYRQNGVHTLVEADQFELERKRRETEGSMRRQRETYNYNYSGASAMRAGRSQARYNNAREEVPGMFNYAYAYAFGPGGAATGAPVSAATLEKMKLKRRSAPLDIEGTPGVESLSTKEKALCSTLRLFPKQYLLIKETFINECQKNGTLLRQHARTLVKIDVNKTGKVFDFMEEAGWLNKPMAAPDSDAPSGGPTATTTAAQ
eukprot:TRINITY_DN3631_c0_g1_i3.p1 TRINITY_DN3631_c0_g1~~TRINITY_DN3631_c0_g1_i3.p1  ORF type:complete len:584 (+),score=187.76 TRINITY_DN3631_c0_g1_i3:68-1819(+)